ncbi:hypothetical protein GGR50DRAFT_157185 [Xylaria sp. CBS 124048]|nr:hypothetical protein GGR50DRAFT_157185 [Xylaria sp. CBS 124048]
MPPNYEQFAGFSIEQVFAGNGPPPGTNPYDVCEPGLWFFLYPPPNSAAVLSTAGGTRQFRGIENWSPDRQIRNWWAADIQRVCDEYRRNMPEACRNVATVHHVYDLYRYFDAYDIYKLGVTNLTRVVNTLVYENTFVQWSIDVEHGERAMFEAKAAELLYDPLMQKRLLAWKKDEQPNISKIFSHEEFKGFSGFEFYSPYNANIVCGILERHYDTLKRGQPLDLSAASFHRSTSDWRAKILADTQAYQRENKGKTSLDEFMKRFILTTPVDDAIATTTATATAHPTTRTIDNASVPPITDTVVNGIVIVDGTSKTAAIRAQQTAAIGSTKKSPKVQETRTPEMSGEDETIRGRSAVVSRPNNTLRTRPRGLSAPMRGGDPGLVDASTRREPRIYSGQSHEVHKVLYGCLKKGLDGPSGTSQESMENTQAAALSSSEIAISTPEPIVTDTAIHGTAQAATASSSEDPMPAIVSSSATNPTFAPIPVRPTRIYSLQNNARSSSFGYPGQVTPMAPRPAAGVLFNPHEPAPLPPMATGPPSGNIPDTRGRYRGISFNQQLPVNVSRPPQIRYTSQPPIVLPGQQPIYINAQSVSITYITNTVTGAPGQMPVHHQNVYVHTIPQQGVQQGPQQNVPQQQTHHPNVPQQQMHHPNVPQQTMRPPSSMAQPVPDSSRNPMQHRRNAGPGSNGSGRWLRAGANDLHGPRVIFRKDTDPSRNVANQRPAQQFEHATDPNRRVSAAVPGVNANHQPFANASFNRPPPGLRYPASGYPRPLGHDPSTLPIKGFPCVNITKAPTPATKFDPCRCFKCHTRDRTIYIGGFRSDLLDQDFVTDRLTEYFVQYGLIDNVHPVKSHVYIR